MAIGICDNGSGIKPEDAKRLFEPFFSTKSAKGTGLGLWISKGIIQKYEGTIHFRSVRTGEWLCYLLPRLSARSGFGRGLEGEAPAPATRAEPMETPMPLKRSVILCVDDETVPLTLRQLVLEKMGFAVLTASSATEALEIQKQHVDLVLTDLLMPGFSGAELARKIKERTPALPIILLSGVNEVPEGANCADLFLSKVEGPARMAAKISEVLGQSRSIDQQKRAAQDFTEQP